ncbi:alpha/beta fold hydrolase [Streptomyces sp. NPDC056296]|uniref:alpha/beta fold hydrolase n=1 Tax=Streptomyces sp. NPDC056296 TaxID=3345775 RepID=UPI0035DA1254
MSFASSSAGQARIWWESAGDGTPVLLINGLSSPSAVWFRLVPMLAGRHRVLSFDNLGTGRTCFEGDSFSMEMMAEAAADVLGAVGAPRAHVLGMSMGGLIAQQLALTHPGLVSSLTLVSTHAGSPHMAQDQSSLEAISRAQGMSPEQRTSYLSDLTYACAGQAEREADLAVRAQYPTSEEGYGKQLAATMGWERLDDLRGLTCPALVLHGARDQLVSVGNARQLAEYIPGARLTVLEDCGHQVFSDQPVIGAQALLDFFADVDAAA